MFQKIESPLAKLGISYAETLQMNTAVSRAFVNKPFHVFLKSWVKSINFAKKAP